MALRSVRERPDSQAQTKAPIIRSRADQNDALGHSLNTRGSTEEITRVSTEALFRP
jgi:hypothetical protein